MYGNINRGRAELIPVGVNDQKINSSQRGFIIIINIFYSIDYRYKHVVQCGEMWRGVISLS